MMSLGVAVLDGKNHHRVRINRLRLGMEIKDWVCEIDIFRKKVKQKNQPTHPPNTAAVNQITQIMLPTPPQTTDPKSLGAATQITMQTVNTNRKNKNMNPNTKTIHGKSRKRRVSNCLTIISSQLKRRHLDWMDHAINIKRILADSTTEWAIKIATSLWAVNSKGNLDRRQGLVPSPPSNSLVTHREASHQLHSDT